MTFKGRLIYPILVLAFTSYVLYIAVSRDEFLKFSNGNLFLFNLVCFLFIGYTSIVLFYFPREVYIDSERLIVRSPSHPLIASREVELSKAAAFELTSLVEVPGYYLRVYLKDNGKGGEEVKKSFTFNIKGRDVDILINKLKEAGLKQREYSWP